MGKFEDHYEAFKASGIQVFTITAEPGDIRHGMESRGLQPLSYPVISNPSLSLMHLKPDDATLEQVFIRSPSYRTKAVLESEYTMVQPALLVVDKNGKILYWWSWSKLPESPLHDDGMIPNKKTEENYAGNTHDVRWRPDVAELLLRLQERIAAADVSIFDCPTFEVKVENQGFPDGTDHVNVVGVEGGKQVRACVAPPPHTPPPPS